MIPAKYDNDELIFLDEDKAGSTDEQSLAGSWNVLVVDDDEEIHSVTRLALSDLVLHNKNLNFIHAHSGAEACQKIEEHGKDLAIILLDVVMESDDAGLKVVKALREDYQLEEPRIILRTGQPGYAPEESVIKEYDINDYKTKTELTRSKLITTTIASLRSYQQILTINESRLGLEKVIAATASLLKERSVSGFCAGVVNHIAELLNIEPQGLVCARSIKQEGHFHVLGAAGSFVSYAENELNNLDDQKIVEAVTACLDAKRHLFRRDHFLLYAKSASFEAVSYMCHPADINETQKQLIEVFISNISIGYENVNLFHKLRKAAFEDWLTKLPNRNQFINMLDSLDSIDNTIVALIDISHFSDVNDGLGEDAGNQVLVSVAKRLAEFFDGKARLGHIGADVFGLIGCQEQVNLDNIEQVFRQPFRAGDHHLPLNFTSGLCRLNSLGDSGIDILKRANIALSLAKKRLNANFEYYDIEMERATSKKLEMIRQLRADFSENRLQLWYQPQFDLMTEKVTGMEALLRWPTADGGFISPAVFVPLAEYSGLIVDIGAWVLKQACSQLCVLNQRFGDGLRMAVNISMPQFRDENFIESVKSIVNEHQLTPTYLELEITESIVMDEPQIVIDALTELKAFGVTIAIDDFGTGFSSLSYLQKLPLDRLKVDRSFVNEVTPGNSAFIAETIVTLGNNLNLQTIAEGVEKREQSLYMLKLGCDEAQGYLYAKPMPFEQLVDFLAQHN